MSSSFEESADPAAGADRRTGFIVVAAFLASGAFAIFRLGGLGFLIGDSWTYFALSRSIGSDFYRVANRTSFAFDSHYSVQYPPLWPTLLFAGQQIFGPTPIAGIVLNFVCLLAFTALAEWIGRRAWCLRWVGVLTGTALLAFAPFVEDMFRATPAAPASLLILAGLCLFVRYPGRIWMPLAFGFVAGATVMTRFDFLVSSIIAITVVAAFERRWLALPLSIVGLVVGLSPWIAYSLAHFHTAFASENRIMATLVDPASVSWDYYPRRPLTAFDDPMGFVRKVLGFLPELLRTIAKVLLLPVAPAILLALVGTLFYRMRRRRESIGFLWAGWPWWNSPTLRLLGFGLVIASAFPAYLATGLVYIPRYLTPFFWYVVFTCLVILGLAAKQGRLAILSGPKARSAISIAAVGLMVVVAVNLSGEARCCGPYAPLPSFDEAATCLKKAGANPGDVVMFVTDRPNSGADHLLAAQFGVLGGGWRSSVQPNNWDQLSADDVAAFADRFGIRFAHIRDQSAFSWLEGKATVTPLPDCAAPLFRFEPIRSGH